MILVEMNYHKLGEEEFFLRSFFFQLGQMDNVAQKANGENGF